LWQEVAQSFAYVVADVFELDHLTVCNAMLGQSSEKK